MFIDSDNDSSSSLTDFKALLSEDDSSSHDSDENEAFSIDDNITEETNTFSNSLRVWVIKFKIMLVALNALLLILRLPKDARTLLKPERFTETTAMGEGKYHHFGLKRAVMSMIKDNIQQGKSV